MRFASEPQREVRVRDDLRTQQLHGHRAPELRVPRPEDSGHPAPPDQRIEAVAAGEHVSGFGHARTVAGIAERRHETGPIPVWGNWTGGGFAGSRRPPDTGGRLESPVQLSVRRWAFAITA